MSNRLKSLVMFCAVAFLVVNLSPVKSAQAIELGKTYDKSNVQEIKDLVIPSVFQWVQRGYCDLKTGQLKYDWKYNDDYVALGKENEGKFDFNSDGILIKKGTNEYVMDYTGLPFPTIDPENPKAAQQIMENQKAGQYMWSADRCEVNLIWVDGEKGRHRDLFSVGDSEYFRNRWKRGPIENPRGLIQQQMSYVIAPFDLRGIVSMFATFVDMREDVGFSYVSMLRRVRRVSAAGRSDPFAGTDFCQDDGNGWAGKNASFTWKYIDQKTLLTPFAGLSKGKEMLYPNDEGTKPVKLAWKIGDDTPGWQGKKWAMTTMFWVPRKTYILEGFPKDPYYNSGKATFYIDSGSYLLTMKEIYTRAGQYWKTGAWIWHLGEDPNGVNWNIIDGGFMYDVTNDHATVGPHQDKEGTKQGINLPLDATGPYTEYGLRQRSK